MLFLQELRKKKRTTTTTGNKEKKETDFTNCSKTISQLTRTYSKGALWKSQLNQFCLHKGIIVTFVIYPSIYDVNSAVHQTTI